MIVSSGNNSKDAVFYVRLKCQHFGISSSAVYGEESWTIFSLARRTMVVSSSPIH
jgi:hypothetical protein